MSGINWRLVVGGWRLVVGGGDVSQPITNHQAPTTNHHLKVDSQIHPRIQLRDLIAVAVEDQRIAPPPFADATFGRLAPSRVRDLRVDVRIKAVFTGRGVAPGRSGLFVGERDLDY